MKPITMSTEGRPKFLFISLDGTEATVVSINDVIGSGPPLTTERPRMGKEMGYVGQVDPAMPEGPVDLNEYDLPDLAKGLLDLWFLGGEGAAATGSPDDPEDEPEEQGRTVMFRKVIEVAAYDRGRRLADVPLTEVEVQAETEGVTVYLPARDEDFGNDPAYLLVERRLQGWTTYVYPGHGRPVRVAVAVGDDGAVTLGAEPEPPARTTP
jgi:hypothetical protein